MPRLTLLLVALVALLGFAVAWVAVRPVPQTMTEDDIRSIVSAALVAEPQQLTDEQVEALIAERLASLTLEDVPNVRSETQDQMQAIVSKALEAAPRPLTDEAVRGLVATALAERDAALPQSHAIDAETINPMIENYLLANPRILQRVSAALEEEIRTAEAEQARVAITSMRAQIFEDPADVVLGNPQGDVTLVEMFDYNCGYCRQAVPDLATLLAEDPNLRVILKEFPILSTGSVDAARVAVVVAQSEADYWQFHQKLYASRGQIDRDTALAVAAEVGLSPVSVQLELDTPKVTAVLDKSYEIARALGVSGTPTYIIGNEIIPGAIGLEGLRQRIANMRACGKTFCEVSETAPADDGQS